MTASHYKLWKRSHHMIAPKYLPDLYDYLCKNHPEKREEFVWDFSRRTARNEHEQKALYKFAVELHRREPRFSLASCINLITLSVSDALN